MPKLIAATNFVLPKILPADVRRIKRVATVHDSSAFLAELNRLFLDKMGATGEDYLTKSRIAA